MGRLRDVIAESDLDERQELLQIIDHTPDATCVSSVSAGSMAGGLTNT